MPRYTNSTANLKSRALQRPKRTPPPLLPPFRFLDLPADLRNVVYALVLGSTGEFWAALDEHLREYLWEFHAPQWGRGLRFPDRRLATYPPAFDDYARLSLVSRQVRGEVREVELPILQDMLRRDMV